MGESSPGMGTAVSPKIMHRDKTAATEIALIKREPMKLKKIKIGHIREFGWKKGKGCMM